MSSNGEKAVAAEVSPVVSTSSSDPLSSPEEDKCILTPLSLEFDPLSWKLDDKSKTNNYSPEHYSAALLTDSVLSKDLMTDSVQSYDLLTMDDNWDSEPKQINAMNEIDSINQINATNCELTGQLIQELQPTLTNSDDSNYDSNQVNQSLNGYARSDSPVDSLTNGCDATDITDNITDTDVNEAYATTDTFDTSDASHTNECQIANDSQSTNQSTAVSQPSEATLVTKQSLVESSDRFSPVNVQSAQLIASKLINDCVSDALHENVIQLTKDQTLNSSSSLSDSSLSDHVSCDSDVSCFGLLNLPLVLFTWFTVGLLSD